MLLQYFYNIFYIVYASKWGLSVSKWIKTTVNFIILVAMFILNTFLSLSCFLWRTATALTTFKMISIDFKHTYLLFMEKQRSFPVIAALISYGQSLPQHNDLKKKSPNELNECPCTYLMAFFSPLPLPESGDPTDSTPGLFLFPWKTDRDRERERGKGYSQSPNWSQASPPPTSVHLFIQRSFFPLPASLSLPALLPDASFWLLKSHGPS